MSHPSQAAREAVVTRIALEKAVAVVRADSAEALVDLARALVDGGVSCVEVTMTVPNALDAITRVCEALGDDALVGVGSVTDPETATAAVAAGARYVVSPVFLADVVAAAHEAGAAAMPGCLTPTEVLTAHRAGADVVKVFPADVVGQAFFKGVLAPLPLPQADADGRGDARQRRRMAARGRGGRRRRLGAGRQDGRRDGRLGHHHGQRPPPPRLDRRRVLVAFRPTRLIP